MPGTINRRGEAKVEKSTLARTCRNLRWSDERVHSSYCDSTLNVVKAAARQH